MKLSYALVNQIGLPVLIFAGTTAVVLMVRKLLLGALHRWARLPIRTIY